MKRAIYRFLIQWKLSSGDDLPAWLQQACQRDPVLKAKLASEQQLSRSLESDKPADRDHQMPSNLESRILEAIGQSKESAAPASSASSARKWLSIATVAAAASIAAIIALNMAPSGSTPGNPHFAEEAAPPISSSIAAIEEAISIELPEAEWENPLDQEIGYIVADGKRAIDFLASSFIPSRLYDPAAAANGDARALN